METIATRNYPLLTVGKVDVQMQLRDLPSDLAENIKMPFKDLSFSEVGYDDLPDAVQRNYTSTAEARFFHIQMPGAFYKHVPESLDTVAVIVCERSRLVMLSEMFSHEAQIRLHDILKSVYEQMECAMRDGRSQIVSQAEMRLLALSPAA